MFDRTIDISTSDGETTTFIVHPERGGPHPAIFFYRGSGGVTGGPERGRRPHNAHPFWDWKYNASDVADWFDAQDEKYWRDHDEWLIQSQLRGETRPIFVFATWASDRINTFP